VQDNYLQSALLSMEALRSKQHNGEAFHDLLSYLDKHNLNRAAENMPAEEELRTWLATGKGLPRNLLAVLTAHTKLDLFDTVFKSRIPDLPLFQPFLASYFPAKIAAQYREQVNHHHLRREIIATVVTNAMINQAGCTLLVQLAKETSLPMDELVVRYFIIDELLGGRALRTAIHACDYQVAAADQYAALLAFEDIHRSLLRWWIWNDRTWSLQPEAVGALKPELDAAIAALTASLDGAAKLALEAREQELLARGFGPQIASTLARAPMLREVFPVIAASRAAKLGLTAAAPLYLQVGKVLHMDAFDELLAAQVPTNPWERRFHTSLEREAAAIRQLAVGKLASEADYLTRHKDRIDQLGDTLRMVKQLGGGLVPLYLILEDYRTPW
jgi:glutamate dehydrogenase